MAKKTYLTYVIAAINIAVFLYVQAGDPRSFIQAYAFFPEELTWQTVPSMVTAGFMHTGFQHLFWNMVFLVLFGKATEDLYGPYSFLSIYFGGIIAGNIAVALIELSSAVIGASGGVYALIGAVIFLEPMRPLTNDIVIPVSVIGFLYLIPELANVQNMDSSISHLSHVAGAVSGICAAVATDRRNLYQAAVVFLAMLALVIGLGIGF